MQQQSGGSDQGERSELNTWIRDKNHLRFMEMYERWRAQLTSDTPCKQFPNFVRAVLVSEKREDIVNL